MKLEMTLPAKPGFLHMLPGLDIIALILMFPLLGPSFVQQTGIDVQVHESPWRYEQPCLLLCVSIFKRHSFCGTCGPNK